MSNQYLKQVESIMQSEVSRGDFIKYVGLAFVGILGITTFIKNLNKNLGSSSTAASKSGGFGSNPYGR